MKDSRLPPFFAGALSGLVIAGAIAAAWHHRSRADLRAEMQRSAASLEELRAELKLARPTPSRTLATPDAVSGVPATQRPTLTFRQGSGAATPEELDKIKAEAGQRLTARRERRIEEKVATLRTRLGLTEGETAKLRRILEANTPSLAGLFEKFLSAGEGGEPGDDVLTELNQAAHLESHGSPQLDEEIRKVLTPAQNEAYAAYRQEQQANQIEMLASKELAALQGTMTLTPEQKDKAFAIITELVSSEIEAAPDTGFDAETMQRKRAARVAALRDVLTPEQLGLYENTGFNFMEFAGPFMELFNVFDADDLAGETDDVDAR